MLSNSFRILLIEDDSSLARSIWCMVQGGQDPVFQVVSAESLHSAASKFRSEKFDAVLLDIHVRDSKNLAPMAEICSHCDLLPTIVLASRTEEELARQCLRAGAAGYLLKETLSPELLRKALHFAIELKRAESPRLSKQLTGIQTGTETILLVEDAEPLRTLIKEILMNCGYKILEAENGNEAIRLARDSRGPIHLLLTDVVMPGMGGEQLAEELLRFLPQMKVLYMSGYPNDGIIRSGFLMGGVALLQKPFTRNILARSVRQALDEQRLTP